MVLEANRLELKRSQEKRYPLGRYAKGGASHRKIGATVPSTKEYEFSGYDVAVEEYANLFSGPEYEWKRELVGKSAAGPVPHHGKEWTVYDLQHLQPNNVRNAYFTGLKTAMSELYAHTMADTALGMRQEWKRPNMRATEVEALVRAMRTETEATLGTLLPYRLVAERPQGSLAINALINSAVGLDELILSVLPDAAESLPSNADEAEPTGLLGALLRLADGWDGDESVAPTAEAKAVIPEVFSRLSRYMASAEAEVDGTTGEATFSWYFNDHTQSVTVTVVPSGRVIVIQSEVGQPSRRTVLKADELARLGRAAVDAGLNRIDG